MKKEIWEDIDGYEGLYEISTYGRLKNNKINKIFATKEYEFYYHTVTLYLNKVKKTTTMHRLVAQAFIPNPLNKPCVNHKDGNKRNNNVDNLEWVTHQENVIHGYIKINKAVQKKMNDNKDLIIKMYLKEKKSLEYISRHLKISYKKIRKFLVKNNIKIRKPNNHKEK